MSSIPPILFPANLTDTVNAFKADYESRSGKKLFPAQPESLVFDSCGYLLYLHKIMMQGAVVQNLVAFATAPILDYLADLVGVTRLAPAPSKCTIRFVLVNGHAAVTIPAGTRVASSDGLSVFATLQDWPVPINVNTWDADVECQTAGIVGNNYAIGLISKIIDPQSYISSASNLGVTAAGADQETDDQLRTRIKLASNSFSTCGPSDAYIYFAKTANTAIVDVKITNTVPGTVNIYPLISPAGTTPTPILQQVLTICSDKKVRPICDTVVVISPDVVSYILTILIVRYTNSPSDTDVINLVKAAVLDYAHNQSKKLGGDVVGASIIAACMSVPYVYKPSLINFNDLVIGDSQVAVLDESNLQITISGTTNG